jgi:hypothetical protein
MMSPKKVTRRDALGLIGKSGITLSTGPFFFLSLGTSPLDGDSLRGAFTEGQVRPPKKRPRIPAQKPPLKPAPEKVMISGTGSNLKVTISGPPGRHCGIVFATSDRRESYKAVARGRGVIKKDGICTLEIDTKNLPNQRVYLRVVTGSTSNFTKNAKGTKTFEVLIAQGTVSRFIGVRERGLQTDEKIVTAATAGYRAKIR